MADTRVCICGHRREAHGRYSTACEYRMQIQGSGYFCDCGSYRGAAEDISGDALDRAIKLIAETEGRTRLPLANAVAAQLEEIDRLRDRIRELKGDLAGEVATRALLLERIADLEQDLATERQSYARLEDELASAKQKLDAMSTDDLLAELRRRITFTP